MSFFFSFFQDQFRTRLDYRDFNCFSILEVCYRLPEIFQVHQDQGKPAMLYPSQSGVVSKAQSGTLLFSDNNERLEKYGSVTSYELTKKILIGKSILLFQERPRVYLKTVEPWVNEAAELANLTRTSSFLTTL